MKQPILIYGGINYLKLLVQIPNPVHQVVLYQHQNHVLRLFPSAHQRAEALQFLNQLQIHAALRYLLALRNPEVHQDLNLLRNPGVLPLPYQNQLVPADLPVHQNPVVHLFLYPLQNPVVHLLV